MEVKRFASEPGAPAKTLAYWNSVVRDVFYSPWELRPRAPDTFSMTMEALAIDDFRLSRATLGQAQIVNTPEPGKHRGDLIYYLQVASSGQHVVWDGGECFMRPGDIMLLNSAMRCSSVTEEDYTTVALTIPGDILRQYLPDPRLAVGQRLPRTEGLSRAASQLLLSLWELSDAGALTDLGGKLSHNLLEIFASSWFANSGALGPGTAAKRARAAQISSYTDQHIRDSDLTVASIAAALGLSSRYIQTIFKEQGEPLRSYIRRKRLDGCRTELMDPSCRDRSITTIAYDWGFNSTGHFPRLFREEFGIAPGYLRKQAAQGWRKDCDPRSSQQARPEKTRGAVGR